MIGVAHGMVLSRVHSFDSSLFYLSWLLCAGITGLVCAKTIAFYYAASKLNQIRETVTTRGDGTPRLGVRLWNRANAVLGTNGGEKNTENDLGELAEHLETIQQVSNQVLEKSGQVLDSLRSRLPVQARNEPAVLTSSEDFDGPSLPPQEEKTVSDQVREKSGKVLDSLRSRLPVQAQNKPSAPPLRSPEEFDNAIESTFPPQEGKEEKEVSASKLPRFITDQSKKAAESIKDLWRSK